MNNKLILGLIIILSVFSCSDDFEGEIVRDNKPEIPVLFTGSTSAGFNPYYTISYAAGTFSITLTIPETSRLKIKEISRVVGGATSINVSSLTAATSIQYIDAPVAVNGYSFTLNSSITEFNSKVPAAASINAAPAAGALVERAFMFQLVMDDNSVIVPVQCRIRITP